MKIEKLKMKLDRLEQLYREARREYGSALAAEITRMHASDLPEEKIERRVHKSQGGKRGPKAKKSMRIGAPTVRTVKSGATAIAGSRRGPGRPKMTPAQKLAARAERQRKLMMTSELGSAAAMDDQAMVTGYDLKAEREARLAHAIV